MTEKISEGQVSGEVRADIQKLSDELRLVTKERDDLKTMLADRDRQIGSLKRSAGGTDSLRKQIEELKLKNREQEEAYAQELRRLQVDVAVDKALTAAKAKNNTAVRALITGLDNAEFNADGTVKGLQDQIERLMMSDDTKFLFDTSAPRFKGFQPQSGDPYGADISKMSYSQMAAYFAANPYNPYAQRDDTFM